MFSSIGKSKRGGIKGEGPGPGAYDGSKQVKNNSSNIASQHLRNLQ